MRPPRADAGDSSVSLVADIYGNDEMDYKFSIRGVFAPCALMGWYGDACKDGH